MVASQPVHEGLLGLVHVDLVESLICLNGLKNVHRNYLFEFIFLGFRFFYYVFSEVNSLVLEFITQIRKDQYVRDD